MFALRTEPRALLRFCDEIEVPLPPLATQETVAATEARLSVSAAMVESARREAWSSPAKAAEIARRFEPLFDTSIRTWLSELPYPIASAIWAFETRRQNPDAARRQIFLVWEAYAAFYAGVLMSALSPGTRPFGWTRCRGFGKRSLTPVSAPPGPAWEPGHLSPSA